MICPECNENEMTAAEARAVGCCESCADKLRHSWAILDRANGY